MSKRKKRKTQWRQQVEQAVKEIKEMYPRAPESRLVWGYANKEEEELAESVAAIPYEVIEISPEGTEKLISRKYPFQEEEALLNWCNEDYELHIHADGDSEHPDPCHITLRAADSQILPRRDARQLFNVLKRCEDGVSLVLIPDDDPEDRDPDIGIGGVTATIPVETMTGRTLHDTLSRLSLSAARLKSYFAGEDDYDIWKAYGGGGDDDLYD
jgi:hypothetical protein